MTDAKEKKSSIREELPRAAMSVLGFDARALRRYGEGLGLNHWHGTVEAEQMGLLGVLASTGDAEACIFPNQGLHWYIGLTVKRTSGRTHVVSRLTVPPEPSVHLRHCRRPLLLVPLTIERFDMRKVWSQRRAFHANLIVIDLRNRTAYRMEPHGRRRGSIHGQAMDRALARRFWRYRIRFTGIPEGCPVGSGPQAIESAEDVKLPLEDQPGGWCAAWALHHLHMQLLEPDLRPSDLLNFITDEPIDARARGGIDSLRAFIASYANVMLELGASVANRASGNHNTVGEWLADYGGRWHAFVRDRTMNQLMEDAASLHRPSSDVEKEKAKRAASLPPAMGLRARTLEQRTSRRHRD